MTVPKGVKVELVASEEQFPELVSPVQMAWDTKGRLWISAWKNYPERTPDEQGRRQAARLRHRRRRQGDKVHDLLDDLNCPTGFQFYKDGVVVMQSPESALPARHQWRRQRRGAGARAQRPRRGGFASRDELHGDRARRRDLPERRRLPPHAGRDGAGPGAQREWRDLSLGAAHAESSSATCAYGFANPHGKVFDYWGNDIITDATGNANYFAPAFSGHIDFPDTHPSMKQFWDRPSRPCPGTAILSSRAWPAEFNGNFLNCNVISIQGIFRVKVTEEGSGLHGETLETSRSRRMTRTSARRASASRRTARSISWTGTSRSSAICSIICATRTASRITAASTG